MGPCLTCSYGPNPFYGQLLDRVWIRLAMKAEKDLDFDSRHAEAHFEALADGALAEPLKSIEIVQILLPPCDQDSVMDWILDVERTLEDLSGLILNNQVNEFRGSFFWCGKNRFCASV